jgi:hypothetical protein
MDITNVSGAAITLDNGSGDNLPAQATKVIVSNKSPEWYPISGTWAEDGGYLKATGTGTKIRLSVTNSADQYYIQCRINCSNANQVYKIYFGCSNSSPYSGPYISFTVGASNGTIALSTGGSVTSNYLHAGAGDVTVFICLWHYAGGSLTLTTGVVGLDVFDMGNVSTSGNTVLLGGDDGGHPLKFSNFSWEKAETDNCKKCPEPCAMCIDDNMPKCLKLTMSGWKVLAVTQCCSCDSSLNNTFYLKRNGACTWAASISNKCIAMIYAQIVQQSGHYKFYLYPGYNYSYGTYNWTFAKSG